jgi:hypothetical protein
MDESEIAMRMTCKAAANAVRRGVTADWIQQGKYPICW